jgi:hypothetical protein
LCGCLCGRADVGFGMGGSTVIGQGGQYPFNNDIICRMHP